MSQAPAPGGAREIAAQWFVLQRNGVLSSAEEQKFAEWLESDAAHAAIYRRIEQAWGVAGAMEEHPSVMEMRDLADQRVDDRKRARFGAVAAGLALIGLSVAGLSQLEAVRNLPGRSLQEYRTDIGATKHIRLADGSIVTLDTNTILRAKMTFWERRITLDRGQAFFEVAKDRSRPFLVGAAGMSVRATGTAFDVRAEPGRFEVTLIEGRVRVQEQGRERDDAPMANMRPGWRLSVGEDARWKMEPVDLVKETSWHNGMLTFYDEPLEKAAAEMNRYSRRQIVFRGAVPSKPIIGHFRVGDVDGFAEAAELNDVARIVSSNADRIELAAE